MTRMENGFLNLGLSSSYRVTVILPALNESVSVGRTVSSVRRILPEAEILVVNDGSTDSTADVARLSDAVVVNHLYTMGNGAAVKSGTRVASGDVLVFMDSDGQHNPEDIPRMLSLIEDGYDMVVGARQQGSQASMGRSWANRAYNWLASYVTGHRIEDLTSGFRVVRADRFRDFLYLLPNGFSYPTTITMAFFRAGYSVCYEPIIAARRVGKSHIKPVRDGIRFLLIIFKVATLYSPLKLFFPVSVFMFFLASAWYAHTLFSIGRFTNMSALLYTGSVITFMMGLISEQIAALMYKNQK